MYMYILMYMNIYITHTNEEFLRNSGQSMSGLINQLLDDYRKGNPVSKNISVPRVKATKEEAFDIIQKNYIEPKLNETITKVTSRGEAFVPKPPDPETGYPCCTKDKPCKHWTFDGTTSSWVNTITGKTREVAL